ncbi:hypothetical protein CB0940_00966 [Cercospora beticola]|uniref:Uncharacterized protein n=1 Tax=Cercospora beticola TaxID=122368 RepID=A0A2G5I951_CERBT|nr:hypothetical protein CB0940_00966 [Cercospora beticola]PIB01325.1 hypothetical protein CB0940_00966 [Cercospora beticola]WPA96391.1 hypothetical protein RHO25_000998 [Cercospora beticola]
MVPAPVSALAQSESKTRLFQRLHLCEDDRAHKELYSLMKREAVAGRKRLIEKESAGSPINETATHAEILRIYKLASPETRTIYDLGKDTDGPEEENWVIRWLLWHSFRYRDQRNNRIRGGNTAPGNQANDDDESSGACSSAQSVTPDQEQDSNGSENASARRNEYWDPVRNQWVSRSP